MKLPLLGLPNGTTCTITGLNKINVIVGKNGCGKSSILKAIETNAPGSEGAWGKIKYISPERGGLLTYEAGIDLNITRDPNWLPNSRRQNQTANFRQQSVAQYRILELAVLRQMEQNVKAHLPNDRLFDAYVEDINTLLDNIEIRRDNEAFQIYRRQTGTPLPATSISSGESELVSLAIECLMYSTEVEAEKSNLLLLDEPDVHLHPDLQSRLIAFLKRLVTSKNFTVFVATHSTAILGELSEYEGASVVFMKSGQTDISFTPITAIYRKILPVFGAHPLSNIFNEAPVLLVEGEDDERIWQQAVRTSRGGIKLFPVVCGSVNEMAEYEQETQRVIQAVYDDSKAYSLRDRDESCKELEDLPNIKRMRLGCRAAENLILCDDVLQSLRLDWEQVKERIGAWLTGNASHSRYELMKQFTEGGFDRKMFDLKELRNLLVGDALDTSKPWEVLVGQTIGRLHKPASGAAIAEHSLLAYLGSLVVENLIPAQE